MEILKTPAIRFNNLPDYPFQPNMVSIPFNGHTLNMHYVDEGDPQAQETIVLLHGQPTWSYLYRKVIPFLVAQGYRVIAPDLMGYGKSDKPADMAVITYANQETWLKVALFDQLDLKNITLFAQDWGGLIGLRLVAFYPERFKRVIVSNTGLPAGGKDSNFTPGDQPRMLLATVGAKIWQFYARRWPWFSIKGMVKQLTSKTLTEQELLAYEAPFPSRKFMATPRIMPSRIPMQPDTAATKRNWTTWKKLKDFDKPFKTAFSDGDMAAKMIPVEHNFQQHVKGAQGVDHVTIKGANHFLQEDQPEQVAREIIALVEADS